MTISTGPSRRDLGLGVLAAGAAAALPAVTSAQTATPWRKLATVAYPGKQDDIAFASPDIGWYGNGAGKLYQTVDGGETWSAVWEQPGTFIRALGFIDDKVGFLGNVGVGYYPNVSDPKPLYRTEDGGRSWTAITAPGIEAVGGICGIDILPVKQIFQGEVRTGHIIHAAGRVGGPPAILSSRDSGQTWSVQDLSSQIGMILDVKFLSPSTGFLCAASSADLEQANAMILRTQDGGTTWTPVYRSNRPFENCWKMSWPSARVGYATVQSYLDSPENTRRLVIKTVDGGASWQELDLVTEAGVQEFGIGFVNDQWGWVGCRAGGYETRDGGRTWAPVAFGRAVNKVRVVQAGRVTRAFAIGVDVYRLDL